MSKSGGLVTKVEEYPSLKHEFSSLSQDELVYFSEKHSDVQLVGKNFYLCACEHLEQV